MTDRVFPDDIDPGSRFRLPLPDRDTLPAEAQILYDRLNDPEGKSLVGLSGPGGVRLHSPKLAIAATAMNSYLRFEADLTPREREVAILVTARSQDCAFEWIAHERAGRKEGVPEETIACIRDKQPTSEIDPEDAVIVDLGRQVFVDRKVSPEVYAAALDRFGPERLVDLVSLMGHYAATAALLTTFDLQLPDGAEQPF